MHEAILHLFTVAYRVTPPLLKLMESTRSGKTAAPESQALWSSDRQTEPCNRGDRGYDAIAT